MGGRVKTHYFEKPAPDNWQYGEFGAMRLPFQDHQGYAFDEHKLVFELIAQLNILNANNLGYNIDLIDFIFKCDE